LKRTRGGAPYRGDIPEALEAANLHGREWRQGHKAGDGVLLRRDLHALYDRGLLEFQEGVTYFDPRVAHHYAHLSGAAVASTSEWSET